jgi:hypothetical protein
VAARHPYRGFTIKTKCHKGGIWECRHWESMVGAWGQTWIGFTSQDDALKYAVSEIDRLIEGEVIECWGAIHQLKPEGNE